MRNDYKEIKRKNREKIKNYKSKSVGEGTVDFFPAYIQLEHTKKCNARCIMCNHFFLGNRGCEDLDENVVQLLEPIFPYCDNIMLNGDGEPFLCANMEKLLRLYHQYNIRVGMNTNLCAVQESLWEIIASGVDFLNVSCDGCTPEVFEGIRRGLSFKSFVGNMKRLRKEAPNVRVNLDCVLMIQNIMQTPDIVDFAADMGFNSIKFNLLGTNPLIGNKGDSVLNFIDASAYFMRIAEECAVYRNIPIVIPKVLKNQTDMSAVERQIRMIKSFDWNEIEKRYKNAVEKNKTIALDTDYLFRRINANQLYQNSIQSSGLCKWAIERCYIDTRGNVTTCCYNTRYCMGNVIESGGFEQIWNGQAYRALRIMMEDGRLPGFCSECSFHRGGIKTDFLQRN